MGKNCGGCKQACMGKSKATPSEKVTTGYVLKELESETYLDEDDDVFYHQVFPADAVRYQTREEAEMALNRVLTKGLELGAIRANFLKFKIVKRVKYT